jgi:hypothetical protein
MTTASEERQRGKEVPPDDLAEPLRREARTCATSLAPASSVASDAVTQGVRTGRLIVARSAAALDRDGSLIDAQPKTFRQARAWHHECAGHYEALAMRWPRLLWGYAHLLVIKPALNFLEWVTESPARLLVAVLLGAVIWIWG